MSDTERQIILNAIARLEGETATSEAIKAITADPSFRVWVRSWITGPLKIIADPNRTRDELQTAKALARI